MAPPPSISRCPGYDPSDASPIATGIRELREETGYFGGTARLIGSIAPNPAILSNICHTVLIEDCLPGAGTSFDPGEDLLTHLFPAGDLPNLVASGRIRHSLVAVAIFHFVRAAGRVNRARSASAESVDARQQDGAPRGLAASAVRWPDRAHAPALRRRGPDSSGIPVWQGHGFVAGSPPTPVLS
jgi:hypothetical protein